MEVALLGPLEIRVDGRIIPVTAPKERAVVSVLALRDGGVVTSRELIAALWGEEPPRSAAKALQTYVSNLRRILPENSIVTASGGYSLVTDGVDTVHFDALAVTGRRRLAEGDNPAAVEALREALGLWRGQGFTELTESPFGAPWATRLQELRRECEEDLVDARLAASDERPPVAELEMAVAAEPLRERRWAQLMLALYRDGRQADALRTFERLRTLLAEEIGIDPSAELRALEAAILVQDPSLLQTPAAVRPLGGTGHQAMTTEAPVGRADLPDPGRKDRSPIWRSDAHRIRPSCFSPTSSTRPRSPMPCNQISPTGSVANISRFCGKRSAAATDASSKTSAMVEWPYLPVPPRRFCVPSLSKEHSSTWLQIYEFGQRSGSEYLPAKWPQRKATTSAIR